MKKRKLSPSPLPPPHIPGLVDPTTPPAPDGLVELETDPQLLVEQLTRLQNVNDDAVRAEETEEETVAEKDKGKGKKKRVEDDLELLLQHEQDERLPNDGPGTPAGSEHEHDDGPLFFLHLLTGANGGTC